MSLEKSVLPSNIQPKIHHLNVDTGWKGYQPFIVGLRKDLTARTFLLRIADDRMEECAVLPKENKNDPEVFDIVLRNDNSNLTLRYKKHDLYLIGYKGYQGKWIEFLSDKRLITGSEFLHYGGSYTELEGKAGKNVDRCTALLGQHQLSNAVDVLAGEPNQENVRAKALLVIIQMTSEAIRFDPILEHLVLVNPWEVEPEPWMVKLENSWSNVGTQLLDAEKNEAYQFKEVRLERYGTTGLGSIETIKQALDILKIVIERKAEVPEAGSGARRSTAVGHAAGSFLHILHSFLHRFFI